MTTRYAPHGVALPPYSTKSRCPKCGHGDIGTGHYADACTKEGCTACDREHLRRTCRNCRYEWAEAVLDCTCEEIDVSRNPETPETMRGRTNPRCIQHGTQVEAGE